VVGAVLYLGQAGQKDDGRNRHSTLENISGAIIAELKRGAEEQGFFEVRKLVLPIIKAQLADSNFALNHTDAKTELQQLIQQTEGDFLEYRIASESGPDHNKTFTVFAMLNSNVIGTGEGHSKREAEQAAAREALKLFGKL